MIVSLPALALSFALAASAPAPSPASSSPKNPVDQLIAAHALIERGELREAHQILDALVARFPGFGLAHLELGELLEKEGAPAERQVQAFETAVRLEPKSPRALLGLGGACDRNQSYERAAEVCRQALQARPARTDIQKRLAVLLVLAGRDREAVSELKTASARYPTDDVLRSHLAEACERLGDFDCARREYEALFARHPSSALHARRLARFYERRGDSARAEATLKKSGEAPRRQLRPLPPSAR